MDVRSHISVLGIIVFISSANYPAFSKPSSPSLTLEQKLDRLIEENEKLKTQLHQLQKEFATHISVQTQTHERAIPPLPAPSVHQQTADKLKLALTGHINRAVTYYDTGRRSEIKHLDNNASSTRLTLTATGSLKNDFKIGAVIEGELTGNNTRNHDIGQASNITSLQERKLEGYLDVPYGQIWLGQGETAANRVSNVDLSGTAAVSDGAEFESFAGGVRFVKGSVPESSQGSTADRDRQVAQVYNEILGSSRKNRLKYVSPSFKGLTFELSHALRDYADIALKYAGEFKAVKIAAALGFASNPFNNAASSTSKIGRRDYGASLSILFPTGISLGGSYAQRVYAINFRNNGSAWSTKIGYQRRFVEIGNTHMAIAYGEGRALFDSTPPSNTPLMPSTFMEDNSEKIRIMGVYLVQKIDKLSTEAYLGYQCHHLTRSAFHALTGATLPSYNFKDIHAVIMGARIKL